MRHHLQSWFPIIALMFALLFGAGGAAAQIVKVDGGEVEGSAWNQSLLFRGIPFAAPPTGQNRWKPPQPVAAWTGVRQSLKQPSSCLQNDYGWNHGDFLIGSEDCLTLDVRTPSLTGKLPVLVWIHGGSNRAGGPNDVVLSDLGKSVVIVGLRYRLGIFGFLSHPKLTAEQGASGNYGLMDQRAALQWVKRNIARFGGDPANITIAGESAGSQDVGLMLVAPSSRQFFSKAIMESGTPGFGLPFRSLKEAERIGEELDRLVGTGGDLDALRKASPAALLAADRKLHDPTLALEPDDFLWLRITIDGHMLPRSPDALLTEAPGKPLIIGTNRIELQLPGGPGNRDAFIAEAFGENAAAARRQYAISGADPPADPRMGTIEDQIATDVIFRCPAAHFAQAMALKAVPVWRYEFDAAPNGAKTSHAAEIAYAFGSARFDGMSLAPYWLNFIVSGNPNGAGLPRWPTLTKAAARHVLFSGLGVSELGALRPHICALRSRI